MSILKAFLSRAASRTAVEDYFTNAIDALVNIKNGVLSVENTLTSMVSYDVHNSVFSDKKVEWFVSAPSSLLRPFLEKKIGVTFKHSGPNTYSTRAAIGLCSCLITLGERPVSGKAGSVVTLTDFKPNPDL